MRLQRELNNLNLAVYTQQSGKQVLVEANVLEQAITELEQKNR